MIDLAKLRAFELPSREKEIVLFGEKQTIKIYATKETTLTRFAKFDPKSVDDQLEGLSLTVADALNISLDDAKRLCEIDFALANEIAVVSNELSVEYRKSVKAEREKAEKNSLSVQENIPAE